MTLLRALLASLVTITVQVQVQHDGITEPSHWIVKCYPATAEGDSAAADDLMYDRHYWQPAWVTTAFEAQVQRQNAPATFVLAPGSYWITTTPWVISGFERYGIPLQRRVTATGADTLLLEGRM